MRDQRTDCAFCLKFGAAPAAPLHAVFDRPVLEGVDFVAVPAVGSLVEGYLLIIPRRHYLNIAEMPAEVLSEFARMKSTVRELLAAHFAPPLFFEHGMVCPTNAAGACVEHAHLHCLPLGADLTPRLAASHRLERIAGLHEVAGQGLLNQSYIYFENQREEKFIIRDPAVPSQYLRRMIAEELGSPDSWDWAVFTFEENARKTSATLARRPR